MTKTTPAPPMALQVASQFQNPFNPRGYFSLLADLFLIGLTLCFLPTTESH